MERSTGITVYNDVANEQMLQGTPIVASVFGRVKLARIEAMQLYEVDTFNYELYLRRHCKSLGFDVTNNHALRMSLNSNVLIPSGFDVRERSLILGHSVEVNEKYYSYAGSFLNPQIMSKAVNVLYPDTDELKIA